MSRKFAILGLLASLLVTSPAHSQLNLNNASPLPAQRTLNRYGLVQGWWAQATIDGSRDKIAHVAIDEQSIALLSTSGILTMLDAETGQKLWAVRVGRRDQATFRPVMNDRLVMVVSGLNLYAIDRLDGRGVWNINLPRIASVSPEADEQQIYIGSLDGSVYAYDLRKIRQLYQEGQLPEYTNNARTWRYQTGKKVTSGPISTGRSVLFASRDHSLYSVTARTRRLLFQFETDAPVSAPIVLHDERLYLASEDFNFYCLNASNGQVHWSFLSGFAIRKSPHVIEGDVNGKREDVVYVLPELGGIAALRAQNGREIWPNPQERAVDFQAASHKLIYATDRSGDTLLIDRSNGNVVGTLPTISFNKKVTNDVTDRLFLVREDGLTVMLREEAAIFPTYHQHPDRRPLLPELYNPALHANEQASAEQPGSEPANGNNSDNENDDNQ